MTVPQRLAAVLEPIGGEDYWVPVNDARVAAFAPCFVIGSNYRVAFIERVRAAGEAFTIRHLWRRMNRKMVTALKFCADEADWLKTLRAS